MTAQAAETLPRFTPNQLGPVVADMAVIVGLALQAKRVETITDLSFLVSADGIQTDAFSQKVILDGFGEEHLSHFVFEAPGINCAVSTNLDSHPLHGGWHNTTRQRLILNEDGDVIRVDEQTSDGKDYQPAGAESANELTILSMAKQATGAEAADIEEAAVPLGKSSGFNDILIDQVGFVPIIGSLLATTGAIAPNLTHVDGKVLVDIYANCSTSRGLYEANKVRIWGTNRMTGSEAVFMVNARPYNAARPKRYAFASVALRTIVTQDGVRTTVLNKLAQDHGQVHRVRQVETKPYEREIIPADFGTIVKMAEFVTKVAQGDAAEYEE